MKGIMDSWLFYKKGERIIPHGVNPYAVRYYITAKSRTEADYMTNYILSICLLLLLKAKKSYIKTICRNIHFSNLKIHKKTVRLYQFRVQPDSFILNILPNICWIFQVTPYWQFNGSWFIEWFIISSPIVTMVPLPVLS